ncbi:MAG: NB-ARC domain-containing protein [Microcystaceae cyanobacterium]
MAFPQDISPQFFDSFAHDYGLSHSQVEVLPFVLQRESPRAIADSIGVSDEAVRKRLSGVYDKVGIQGRGPVKFGQLQRCLIALYNTQINDRQARHADEKKSLDQPSFAIDWSDAPDVTRFTGRSQELTLLNSWTVGQQCRLVGIFGLQGVGKTALAVKIAQQIQEQFECVVWRTLTPKTSPSLLFSDLIQFFHQKENLTYHRGKRSINSQIHWLNSYLRSHRCLIILDGFDMVFRRRELAGVYRKGYDAYGHFLGKFAQESSRSCFIITSREKSKEFCFFEEKEGSVNYLMLKGLTDGAYSLLEHKYLFKQEVWNEFIEIYQGNPLMLKLVAMTIQEVFEGNVAEFLATTRLTNEITHLVSEILTCLSLLEHNLIRVMAQQEAPYNVQELQHQLQNVTAQEILTAIQSLKRRSLVESREGGFTLIPIVKEAIDS